MNIIRGAQKGSDYLNSSTANKKASGFPLVERSEANTLLFQLLDEITGSSQAKLSKYAKKLLQFGQTGFIMTLFKGHIFSF